MDDLTKIKGIGKATADKLAAAGYATIAALAAATTAEDLRKLQDAGFVTVDIDKWIAEAALLAAVGDVASQEKPPVIPQGMTVTFDRPLSALQEVRHLGVTYGPGDPLPDTVDEVEAEYLKRIGAAEPA